MKILSKRLNADSAIFNRVHDKLSNVSRQIISLSQEVDRVAQKSPEAAKGVQKVSKELQKMTFEIEQAKNKEDYLDLFKHLETLKTSAMANLIIHAMEGSAESKHLEESLKYISKSVNDVHSWFRDELATKHPEEYKEQLKPVLWREFKGHFDNIRIEATRRLAMFEKLEKGEIKGATKEFMRNVLDKIRAECDNAQKAMENFPNEFSPKEQEQKPKFRLVKK